MEEQQEVWRVCRQLAGQQTAHPLGHIQSKGLSPDLTRAKAGRPPTRIHVPTHTSWQHPATNPCCYRAYRTERTVVIACDPHSLAAHKMNFSAFSPMGSPV